MADGKKAGCNDCIQSMITANTKMWAHYGHFVGTLRTSTLMFCVGAAIVIGLSVGIIQVEYENSLDALWVEKGSRAADETDYTNEHFGGPGRLNLMAYSLAKDKWKDVHAENSEDHGVLTKEALYAFGNSTVDLLYETGKYSVNRTFTYNNLPKQVNFTWKDFCSRPKMPGALSPWRLIFPTSTPTSAQLIQSWLYSSSVGSGSLQHLTSCLGQFAAGTLASKNSTTITPAEYVQLQMWYDRDIDSYLDAISTVKNALSASRLGLPVGWGVDRAPCTRATVHDAFSDGIFDYPASLRQLNDYSYALASMSDMFTQVDFTPYGAPYPAHALKAQLGVGENTWFDKCYFNLNSTIYGAAPTQAVTVMSLIGNYLTFGIGIGYWWRPSIEDQALTPATLANAMFESIKNSYKYDAKTCVAEGLFRKMSSIKRLGSPVPFYRITSFTPLQGGCLRLWSGTSLTIPLFAGGLEPEDLNTTSTTTRFAVALSLTNSGVNTDFKFLHDRIKTELKIDSITGAEALEIVRDIEQIMIDTFSDMRDRVQGSGYASGESYQEFEMYYTMDRSTSDLFDDAANLEGSLLIGGYLALIIYSCFNFILFTCPPSAAGWVYSRAFLIFLGQCTVGMSIAASFGFCGWVGLKLSPVNSTLIPFLGLGLGTSDIFVFVHELFRHKTHQDNPRERITLTMADAGSSVMVSSFANIAAFLIPGGIVKLPAIYTFSLQMGVCIILNWTTAMTMFVPFMVFNAYSTAARGLCCKAKSDEEGLKAWSLDSLWQWIAERILCPLYGNLVFKLFAIAAFIGLTVGFAVHGFQATKNGLMLSDVVLKSHYAYDYLKLKERYFNILPGSMITRNIDYLDNGQNVTFPQFQANVLNVLNVTGSNKYLDQINTPTSQYFLPAFIDFAKLVSPIPVTTTVPTLVFYPLLRQFLATSGSIYTSDLVCRNVTSDELTDCALVDGITIKLEVTSCTVYYTNMVTDQDYVDAIKTIRQTADSAAGNKRSDGKQLSPVPVFYAGSLFKYWQQYVTIEDTTYKTVGFSLLGVFCISMLTQASPISSLMVGLMLFATVLQLYGFMAVLGIKLNGWSATNLGVCVGVSVQTTAYYSSAFLRAHAESEDPNERMKRSLIEMFPPLFHGAITTLVSVVVLAFAKFPFFRLYFFVMIGMMVALSFLNGVVFLPVILSFLAPRGLDRSHKAETLAFPEDRLASKKDGLDNSAL